MDSIDLKDVANRVSEKICGGRKELATLNLMILGKTGVGKSTLINSLFGKKVAETGVGRPVTEAIYKYKAPDCSLAIYDAPGLELSGVNEVDNLAQQVIDRVKKGLESGQIDRAIHCILYCVSTPSRRFEQSESDFLRKVSDGLKASYISAGDLSDNLDCFDLPIIVVLTQAYAKSDAQALRSVILRENLKVDRVIPVLAESCDIGGGYIAKAYGLDKLAEAVNGLIPKAVSKTFSALQVVNVALKQNNARKIVFKAALAATAIGFNPVPFSDAFLLVPEQIGMLAAITVAFGLPLDKSNVLAILTATVGTVGTTVAGRTVVANILKLLPGAGTVVGGAISGATAAALTVALGESYIAVLTKVCQGEMKMSELGTASSKKMMAQIFRDQMALKRDNQGRPL